MTTPLHTLLEHAERERDNALAVLNRCEAYVQRLQQQALQLQAYRDEYRARAPGRGGQGADIALLRTHHAFMERLDHAWEQLSAQVGQAQQQATARRCELLALETRVASVRKLMQRRDAEQRQREERQDQRSTDEQAARRHGAVRPFESTSRTGTH